MTTAPFSPRSAPDERISVMRLMWRLFTYRPGLFLVNVLLWAGFHTLPLAFGYYAARLFDHLEANAITAAWAALALFGVARAGRFAVFAIAFRTWVRIWYMLDALVRRNLLGYLLTARGSRRLPDTPAEAVSRFRDDVAEVAAYTEFFVDGSGILLYAVIAVALLWRVDPVVTIVVCVPMILMVLLVRRLSPTIRAYRRRSREATGRVTDFIGESFAAVQTVKLAAREEHLTRHLEKLGEVRRHAALRDVLLTELIKSVNTNMVTLATGLVLLLAAAKFRTGAFTIGDFALFAAYLPRLANSMGFFGNMFAQHRRTGVSFERMQRLTQDAPVEALVAHTPLHLTDEPPAPPPPPRRETLRELRVEGLTAVYENGRGVHDVRFTVQRGEFVVVTGRIGSGKTTLVRALLGLIPAQAGRVWWNGQLVADPATFFVPPRSAYTAQLPQLFSETLRENVLHGEHETRLERAMELSVLRSDVGQLELGLDTLVGARGVKLSGGQVSRSAAARMFARDAELLVFDDLSSALDVETERRLWEGVFEHLGATCLVVSHRRAALLRADRVVLLHEGRVVDEGRLGDLLERNEEMRALWVDGDAPEA